MSDNSKTKADPFGSEWQAPPIDEALVDRGWMDRDVEQDLSHVSTPSGILPEGSRFGVYTVGSCIGHGGMARIYRAEHEGLRRSVALKVLLEDFAQDQEGHERFLREGRIAAAIKHPNVVNIFDVGFQGAIPYLVMEFLDGEDLEAMMYAKGSIPEATVIDLLVPIVAGLSAVHDAGVIHRDLKPGNIFLSRGRNDEIEPKLLDFGISKSADTEQFKLTTARGLLIGTPLYMSPEAIRGEEVTARSDQYSLGVVLYECCTGFNPFAADTLAETVRRISVGDFPPPGQRNPALSKRIGRIIERAMHVDPSQRFSDLRELGRELLFLAGQRTRITWSLTFGEIVSRRTGELAQMSAALRVPRAPVDRTNLSSIAAVAFGVVMFVSAVAVVWSRQSAEDAGAQDRLVVSQSASLRANVDGRGQPLTGDPAALPPPSTQPVAPLPSPASKTPDAELSRAKNPEVAAALESEEGGPIHEPARRRVEPAPRAQSKRRSAQEVQPRRRPTPAASNRPEWVPAETPRQAPPKREPAPDLGTNNAPIFE